MAADSVNLRAFDEFAGQAVLESGGAWYRVSCDDDWFPVELPDRNAAIRCILLSPFEARDDTFPSMEHLQSHLRELWRQAFEVDDIPLSSIIHLLPATIQRYYHRLEDRRSARVNWERDQSRRYHEAWKPDKPSPEPGLPIPIEIRVPPGLPVPVEFRVPPLFELREWPQLAPHTWRKVWRYTKYIASSEFEMQFQSLRPASFDDEDIASVAITKVLWYLQSEPEPTIQDFRGIVSFFVRHTCTDSFRAVYRRSRSRGPYIEAGYLKLDQIPDNRTDKTIVRMRDDIQQAIENVKSRLTERELPIADAVVSRWSGDAPRRPLRELSMSLQTHPDRLYRTMSKIRKFLAAELQAMGYGSQQVGPNPFAEH